MVTGTAEYQPDTYLIKPVTEATLRMRLAKIWAKKAAFAGIDKELRGATTHRRSACATNVWRWTGQRSRSAAAARQLLLTSGDLDQARQGYAAVLATRDTPWARLGMAKVMYQSGDFAGAKQMLEATIGDNSAFLEAYDWLAKTLQATGEIEAAGEILERAARLPPNSVLRQKSLGEVALKLGNLDGAERAFRKSVSLGEHSQ